MAPQKQTWAWRSSHDVLCAIHETLVGLSMLASTLLVGTCAWYGMFSQRGFMRGSALMPSAHSQRINCTGQAQTTAAHEYAKDVICI